ncbi:MAG: hypothetical protein LUG99_21210 [Lachnospiraceae bacterium]|nr:hypothetical protein [Lachnospiraceae bacterium]
MAKRFNMTGACIPARHYMVDLTSRLMEIYKGAFGGLGLATKYAAQFHENVKSFLKIYLNFFFGFGGRENLEHVKKSGISGGFEFPRAL